MFFKPIKYEEIVVNPPEEIKKQSRQIFDRIIKNYDENYKRVRSNPQGNLIGDPWFRREVWRWDPYFSKENVLRKAFPGLGVAITAFTIYLAIEFYQDKGKSAKESGKETHNSNQH